MKKNKLINLKTFILFFSIVSLLCLVYFLTNKSSDLSDSESLNYVEKEVSDVKDNITVISDTLGLKKISSNQLEVWLQSNGRYGIKLLSSGSTVYYSGDSAYAHIIREGQQFPTGLPSNFSNLTIKSFTVSPDGVIEQVRYDNDFEYTLRISIVNSTNLGGYMKVEMDAYNKSTHVKQMGVSFNQDTMINGNDAAPFKIVENGWIVFSGDVQATAYYKDVFNTTQADAIFLGYYSRQLPMPINDFYAGMADISPGDSGAGFYYNLENVNPGEHRKESWIIGVGPKNSNPSFNLTSPTDNSTYYSGQTVPISGIVKDTDIGDMLEVKWSIDSGAENNLTSLTATGSNQNFAYNYVIPNNLSQGWHTFQFWVMDDKGGVSSSNSKQIYINNFNVPGVPTFSNVTNNSMVVSFDTKGNESDTTYEIYKTIDNSTVDLNKNTILSLSDLSVNTQYGFKVRAKNTSNEYTDYSNIGYSYTLANTPNNGSIDSSINGTANLSWGSNGNPNDTVYVYEVKDKNTGTIVKSGTTKDTSVILSDIPTETYYNIYVRALNGDNVKTEDLFLGEFYQDVTPPVVTHTLNPNSWTKDDVIITLNATDSGSGLKTIENPEEILINGDNTTYKVSNNGVYNFKVSDNSGNVTIHKVTVSNIDKIKPTNPKINTNEEWTLDSSVEVSINGSTDSLSGLKNIEYKLDDDDSWTTYNDVFNVTKKGITKITARAVDNVGNFSEEVISYVKIDTPSVIEIIKDKTDWTSSDVNLHIIGSDVDGGVIKFILPDNSELNGSDINYNIKNNGKYKFIAVDSYGNLTTFFETISNIDKDIPSKPKINLSSTEWSPKGVHFNISNISDIGSGVEKIEYRYNQGKWNTYKESSEVTIDDDLQGIINIEARVIDKVGNISKFDSAIAKIDDIKPVIDKVEIVNIKDDNQGFKVTAHDNESGLNSKGAYTYYLKVNGVDSDFNTVSKNVKNDIYNVSNNPSSTLNLIKSTVIDNNDNVSEFSKTLAVVTAPIVKDIKAGGEGEYDNTVTIELNNPIGKDVKVEIYRGDKLISILTNGSQFKDKNLYYERSYDYRLVAYSTVDGERIDSLPETVSVNIGTPTLEARPDSSIYSITPFTDEVIITGEAAFAQGGTALIDLFDKTNNVSKNLNGVTKVTLNQKVKTNWKIILKLSESELSNIESNNYRLELDLEDFKDTGIYKKSWDIYVDFKDIQVNPLETNLKNKLY